MQERPEIGAVVVHHRSYDSLLATVSRIITEGVSPHKLVVVDNSERSADATRLEADLPPHVSLVVTTNEGYGAAVNRGVQWHVSNQTDASYLLVSTHESLPESGAVSRLAAALDSNPQAAVVGPVLVTGSESNILWSVGGTFTKILGFPRHRFHKADRSELLGLKRTPVAWLDGAFLLFRKAVIEEHPIDERFFLYMEETDHQRRLNRLGWDILIEPQAVVWQSSNGVPPYYQTRNIQLFHAKNGSKLQRYASAPYIILRALARDLVKKRGIGDWLPLLSGLRSGLKFRMEQSETTRGVHIVNPLGGALAHYTKALDSLLTDIGVLVRVSSILEPSVSGEGRVSWLAQYLRLLMDTRKSRKNEKILIVWPVLGFLDILFSRLLCRQAVSIVYHDPKPLVRSTGTGRLVASFVALWPLKAKVIVHSSVAADAMDDVGLGEGQAVLEHPMLPPTGSSSTEVASRSSRPIVRVLGQYKQDRDMEVLRALSAELAGRYELEVVGRGWPSVTGWKVEARFVSESELDELIRSSDVVVIPYKRFYQSGIAVRALELGTPIVGRAQTSLSDIYGKESKLLVQDHDELDAYSRAWSIAVEHAIKEGAFEARIAAERKYDEVFDDWHHWVSLAVSYSI